MSFQTPEKSQAGAPVTRWAPRRCERTVGVSHVTVSGAEEPGASVTRPGHRPALCSMGMGDEDDRAGLPLTVRTRSVTSALRWHCVRFALALEITLAPLLPLRGVFKLQRKTT